MSGIGILAYVAAWAIIPERPTHIDVDYDIDSDSAAEDQKQSSNEDKY